jgi:hypothetical protein
LGAAKFSLPSRKNGRFSGNESACRGSYTTWPTSDSTCEKSGLNRGVRREVRGHAPAQVQAELTVRRGALEIVRGHAPAVTAFGERGVHIEHQSALQVGHVAERAGLAEERGAAAQDRRPGLQVAGVSHAAQHVDAPCLDALRLVADALEGDAQLDLVAVVRQPAARLEQEVRTEVDGAAVRRIGHGAVRLHAQRVDAEQQRTAAVVEGVQHDVDEVVAADAIAVGMRGDDGAVRLEGADADVEGVVGVEHQHLRRVGGGDAVHGLVLGEAGEQGGVRPLRLREHAVDADRAVDARHGHGERTVPPVIDGGRPHGVRCSCRALRGGGGHQAGQ